MSENFKLYRVDVDHEIWVIAESVSEAEDFAKDALRQEYGIEFFAHEATSSTFGAMGVDDSIPWGERDENDPDRTVKEWRKKLGIEWKDSP